SGDIDLAAEAIRLTRQLAASLDGPADDPADDPTDDPEVQGVLPLMPLPHARRLSRTRPDGSIVMLADQDRSRWDRGLIAEGIDILQAHPARDRLPAYSRRARRAPLHSE